MVWTESRGSAVSRARPPAASDTIMVSPMARAMASRNAAMMPLSAPGTTTLTETSNFVAPQA